MHEWSISSNHLLFLYSTLESSLKSAPTSFSGAGVGVSLRYRIILIIAYDVFANGELTCSNVRQYMHEWSQSSNHLLFLHSTLESSLKSAPTSFSGTGAGVSLSYFNIVS
jgi:hypothetical protein